jgi:hypothetical protein
MVVSLALFSLVFAKEARISVGPLRGPLVKKIAHKQG